MQVAWRENGAVYVAERPERMPDYETCEGTQLPKEVMRAAYHEGLTAAPDPLPDNVFVKTPIVLGESWSKGDHGARLLHEAEIMDLLNRKQHTNICEYLGVVREGQYFTAICVRRYDITLKQAVDEAMVFDRKRLLRGLLAGVEVSHLCYESSSNLLKPVSAQFIHSIGLIHNDLNPENIMLDKQKNAVIVDFGSCRRRGEIGPQEGTHNWYLPSAMVSHKANDYRALLLISKFLIGLYDPHGDDDGQDVVKGIPYTESDYDPNTSRCLNIELTTTIADIPSIPVLDVFDADDQACGGHYSKGRFARIFEAFPKPRIPAKHGTS